MKRTRIPHLSTLESVLTLLDAIANSPVMIGCDDIEKLCEARRLIAERVGRQYDAGTNSHVIKTRKALTTP
jgi:hypothetical protein